MPARRTPASPGSVSAQSFQPVGQRGRRARQPERDQLAGSRLGVLAAEQVEQRRARERADRQVGEQRMQRVPDPGPQSASLTGPAGIASRTDLPIVLAGGSRAAVDSRRSARAVGSGLVMAPGTPVRVRASERRCVSASNCPRSSATCAGRSARDGARRRGVRVRLDLGRRPPALPRRGPRARPVGGVDLARRAGRGHQPRDARAAGGVPGVPPAGRAGEDGGDGRRGQRRALRARRRRGLERGRVRRLRHPVRPARGALRRGASRSCAACSPASA